jgi:2-succinyl-6-hydroxy-2,4-cyclohexadiene-1-carboxylate synthase
MYGFLAFWYDQPLFATLKGRPDLLTGLKQRRLNNDSEGLVASLRVLGTGQQPSFWNSLDKINMPLLLIVGEEDTKFTHIARQMGDLCPNAEVRIIPDTGHNVHLEQPEQFRCALRDFLITGV